MRSRNGNHSFLYSICSIIFFNSLALNASEFLISYKYVVKDAVLYNETLNISEAMRKCVGVPFKELILSNEGDRNLKNIIIKNQEQFIQFISSMPMYIKSQDKTVNLQNNSTMTLILKTTCFKVDFNDNFVKIAPLK